MKCPRTGEPLLKRTFGDLEVDISQGCGGIWFDRSELPKVKYKHQELGKLIVEHLREHANPFLDTAPRLNCPRDTDVVMMRRYFSSRRQIEIDECPKCGGIWLDAEELEGIRGLFRNAADRARATEEFVDSVMNSPQVQAYERESDELRAKLEGIGSLLWRLIPFR
jgi:uncharacterized protein